jgi:hypothetical protein
MADIITSLADSAMCVGLGELVPVSQQNTMLNVWLRLSSDVSVADASTETSYADSIPMSQHATALDVPLFNAVSGSYIGVSDGVASATFKVAPQFWA